MSWGTQSSRVLTKIKHILYARVVLVVPMTRTFLRENLDVSN